MAIVPRLEAGALPTEPTCFRKRRLPLGTIAVRPNHSRRDRYHREIKVCTRRGAKCWMSYARWWWLVNRGPVPEGKLVLHRDGNSLNDDPTNFILGTHGDQTYINHSTDPEMSERNYRKAARATALSNARRAKERRENGWLSARWYPVDHAAMIIYNIPCRTRCAVWAQGLGGLGLDAAPALLNGRGVDQVMLGWEGVTVVGAIILSELAEYRLARLRLGRGDGWLRSDVLDSLLQRARAGRTQPRVALNVRCTEMSRLHRARLVDSRRIQGVNMSEHRITDLALAARGTYSTIAPMRGGAIREAWKTCGILEGYRRVAPAGGPPPTRVSTAVASRVRKEKCCVESR